MAPRARSSQFALAAVTAMFLLALPGTSQVQGQPAYLRLQKATPGIQQTGHANISGTLLTGWLSTSGVSVNATGSVDGVSSVSDRNGLLGVNRGLLTLGGLGTQDSGVHADGGNTLPGLLALTGSTTAPAVDAEAYSSNDAVYGHSANGPGLHGVRSSNSGLGTGPFSPAAILGESGAGNGVLGVVSGAYAGAAGYAPNGTGVYGYSVLGSGVIGYSLGPSNQTYGVYGITPALGGTAIHGEATATTTWTIGVLGSSYSPSGYGVYCFGRFNATGTKSFQIDDPLDPENKVLNHYCTEGAEPLNVYSGNVTTDSRGFATVTLPTWLHLINRDFRYQLTVLDDGDREGFVMAKVVQKVRNNRFVVRTSAPRVEVSWRLEGVRNDRFVQKYGAPVELEKEQRNRGKYLQPELYGKPAEMGQFYQPPLKPGMVPNRPVTP